jgi:hypothetical protein
METNPYEPPQSPPSELVQSMRRLRREFWLVLLLEVGVIAALVAWLL